MNNNIIVSNSKQCGSVGLKIEDNKFKFVFPPKYVVDEQNKQGIDDFKQDIFKLLELIQKYKQNDIDENNLNEKSEIPLYAMLWLVSDFLQHGLYKEVEASKKIQNSGKINWKQTIKKCRPFLDEDNNIFYNKFVINEVKLKQDDYFVEIQEYCIKKSINLIGWYFNLQYEKCEEKSNQEINEYLTFLKLILLNTFFDYKKQLVLNMISVLEELCDENSTFNKNEIFTDKFEIVFENLIVDIFSIKRDLLKFFYPSSTWFSVDGEKKERSYLRPDAIDFSGENVYILDAKNYSYGYDENVGTLPETSSVQKQITYAQYLKTNYEQIKDKMVKNNKQIMLQNIDKIYNFFILPTYKANLKNCAIKDDEDCYIKYIGHFVPDWCGCEKTFEKIHTLLVDLKTLVDAHFDTKLKQKLRQQFYEICEYKNLK